MLDALLEAPLPDTSFSLQTMTQFGGRWKTERGFSERQKWYRNDQLKQAMERIQRNQVENLKSLD